MNTLKETIEHILPAVVKPARYIGGELNVIKKDPAAQNIKVCLAFPDIYDIGQSYIGFYILYHILNKREGTLCERTFAPWTDMERIMRSKAIPLWSLESFLPVQEFDVVGFTLQYELHYATILNMLELAGIPVMAQERTETHPLIIGGGPCCANPEPVADFFDAFLLGDGEEAFPEMLDKIEQCRHSGKSRTDTLLELATVEGVYVPSLYRPVAGENCSFAGLEPLTDKASFPVHARFVTELKPDHYPTHPLVPLCEVVHDRLAVEIMRGCSRGCRFCGAGMTYRPKRMRPVDDVFEQVVQGIKATGWEDVSLVSLSNSDYDGIEEAVKRIGRELKDKAVSISLSSLRADNFSLAMADAVAGGKKSSLTFAVEAGTQRLRNVINKNLTEEQLFETVNAALSGGWNAFKLYFMIGHPTETDEDVVEIAHLLNRLGAVLKKYQGRRINVTVSSFCPKSMTPFQWERQDSVAALKRKVLLIKDNLRSRQIHIKETDPYVSMLECLLGRGGRDIGAIIVAAWKKGCRLDGWSEQFDGEKWRASFEEAGITMGNGSSELNPGTPLPWGHLSFGVDESFLVAEREAAYAGITTSDCTEKCHNCGSYTAFCASMKNRSDSGSHQVPEKERLYGRKKKPLIAKTGAVSLNRSRIRMKFGKNGALRFIGHLDMVRIFNRTLRRANIPVAYSQGFHPHPKISFGPPLPLGMKSIAEYVDFSLSAPFRNIREVLEKELPEGFSLFGIRSIPEKIKSLNEIIKLAEYEVQFESDESIDAAIKDLLGRDSIQIERMTKKGVKTVDIRPGIVNIGAKGNDGGITMLLRLGHENSAKPSEVLALLFGDNIPDNVTRTEQYALGNDEPVTPLDVI